MFRWGTNGVIRSPRKRRPTQLRPNSSVGYADDQVMISTVRGPCPHFHGFRVPRSGMRTDTDSPARRPRIAQAAYHLTAWRDMPNNHASRSGIGTLNAFRLSTSALVPHHDWLLFWRTSLVPHRLIAGSRANHHVAGPTLAATVSTAARPDHHSGLQHFTCIADPGCPGPRRETGC